MKPAALIVAVLVSVAEAAYAEKHWRAMRAKDWAALAFMSAVAGGAFWIGLRE